METSGTWAFAFLTKIPSEKFMKNSKVFVLYAKNILTSSRWRQTISPHGRRADAPLRKIARCSAVNATAEKEERKFLLKFK